MSSTVRLGPALVACALLIGASQTGQAKESVPPFQAIELTGRHVGRADLLGKPAILIVTPGRRAAHNTRDWVDHLRSQLDLSAVRVRDLIVVELPFFMNDGDAIKAAKKVVPASYGNQTWLMSNPKLENALGITPGSDSAQILVIDRNGTVRAHVTGGPDKQRIAEIRSALASIK
ncbi:MAG: hypothetical protein M3Z16_01845 [Pseudomonadota bacterium]|nr:hypothetical protein [Pseudomonadota bacterium]